MTVPARSGRRNVVRVGSVVAAVLVVGAAAAAATGCGFPAGGDDGESPAAAGLPPATAAATRQTLVDSQTEDGELGYGETTSLIAKLTGTVTALPAAGSTVERGQALYRVDDAPVVLLYGPLPAYRTLSPGTEGADVEQFERNLSELGYRGFTVDDTYSSATATAVRSWQEDLGLPETGTVDQGRIGYTAGPVRVDTLTAAVGAEVKPGSAVFVHTALARVVTVELDMSDQRLARTDAAVGITLPNDETVGGRIVATRTVIEPAQEQDPETTKIEVTVTVDDEAALAGLDQASVDVDFTASQREDVLTVPVTALLALAEGGYGVQVVDGPTSRIVAVETGLFAAGRVEVSGDGLVDGAMVGIPE